AVRETDSACLASGVVDRTSGPATYATPLVASFNARAASRTAVLRGSSLVFEPLQFRHWQRTPNRHGGTVRRRRSAPAEQKKRDAGPARASLRAPDGMPRVALK